MLVSPAPAAGRVTPSAWGRPLGVHSYAPHIIAPTNLSSNLVVTQMCLHTQILQDINSRKRGVFLIHNRSLHRIEKVDCIMLGQFAEVDPNAQICSSRAPRVSSAYLSTLSQKVPGCNLWLTTDPDASSTMYSVRFVGIYLTGWVVYTMSVLAHIFPLPHWGRPSPPKAAPNPRSAKSRLPFLSRIFWDAHGDAARSLYWFWTTRPWNHPYPPPRLATAKEAPI